MAQDDSKDSKKRPPVLIMNNQLMLREIKENLKHLKRRESPQIGTPSHEARTTASASSENCASSVANSPKYQQQQVRRYNGSGHAETLAKIRSSLEPYAASESGYSSCSDGPSLDVNKQYLHQLVIAGFDEEAAVQALRVTSSRSVQAALDILTSQVQTKDRHSPNNIPSVNQMYAQNRLRSPPSYNAAIQRNSWKGSQEALNIPKRPESPSTRDLQASISTPRNASPTSSNSSLEGEWNSKREMPYSMASNPHSRPIVSRVMAIQEQVPKQGIPTSSRMHVGWKPVSSQATAHPTYNMQGLPSQGQHFQVNLHGLPPQVSQQPAPPQFQVTAQVNLSTSTNRNDVFNKPSVIRSTNPRPSASPMSFHVQVHTNCPPSQPAPKVVQSRNVSSNHSSREGSGDSQGHRHSPISKNYSSNIPQIGLSHHNDNSVPCFVNFTDSKAQPPPYTPNAQRLSGTSDATSGLGCSSLSSVSSQSTYLSSQQYNDKWRNSWNTEVSSNSSMSDEPFMNSVCDSGPPSPFSDNSQLPEGNMTATTIQGTGGAVIQYNIDPSRNRHDTDMINCEESMDLDNEDDESISSGEEFNNPKSMKDLKCKIKNCTPDAYKFYMEQHVENIVRSQEQRAQRKNQLEAEMAKVGLSEESKAQMREILKIKETNYMRLKRTKMGIGMFDKLKMIGIGAFGEVWLVRKIDTNKLFALKILRKADVLRRNQAAHVKAERDILAEADDEWFVKLYYSFQDKEFLYFVMDYIPGGDLMSLLIKFGIFPENTAKFYIAELVLAIESVHKLGYGHRDIKPDNILIDKDGHIKLTDFGLCTGFRWTHDSKYYQRTHHSRQDSVEPDEREWECMKAHCQCGDISIDKPYNQMKPLERRHFRKHMRCQAHSLVGTPNYIAPEVLCRIGYTKDCDWWSVGVILYEMLVGQPPFLAPTPAETQMKVINWSQTLHIPRLAGLSSEAEDLIFRLCTSADRRLGVNGAWEIKQHPFFAGVDWDICRNKVGVEPPYIPYIRYPTDTSNFDPVDPDRFKTSDSGEISPDKLVPDKSRRSEHAFFEFTFRRFFDDAGHNQGFTWTPREGDDDEDSSKAPVYV